jgi:hypothetical protein
MILGNLPLGFAWPAKKPHLVVLCKLQAAPLSIHHSKRIQ